MLDKIHRASSVEGKLCTRSTPTYSALLGVTFLVRKCIILNSVALESLS